MSEDFRVPGGLAAGSRVGGYLVEEPLGAGGMAVVYRARDERLGRLVALKVLAPALAADAEFRSRFTAESLAAAAVDHPHVLPVYEAGEDGRTLFIAMRLVTGGDLRRVLAREGPLSSERAAAFLSPVASGLDAAHAAGLVHRDVKPANVLVDSAPGRPEHVYLSDFGISRSASAAGLTGTARFLGTPEYMSPEQVRGAAVDGRADQYALACVAWQLLTGTVPFQRDQGLAVLFAQLHEPPPLDSVRSGMPAAAGLVLARALAKEPGERYASCGEFADALRDALGLPPYRPGVQALGTGTADAAVAVADALARDVADSGLRPLLAPDAPAPDAPTQDVTAPGQRLRPGRGPDTAPGRPGRRRRRATIALAGTLAAAATAVALLLALPGTAKPPPGRPGGTAPVTSSAAVASTEHTTTPAEHTTASGTAAGSATSPPPPAGTLTATLADVGGKGVRAVAFSPGGTLAAADANGRVYLWDTATGKVTVTLTDPGSKGVNSVAFGPGSTLAAADANGSAYLWDTATGKITLTLTDPGSSGVSGVAFGRGESTVATGDENGRTYLWDAATGALTEYQITSTSREVSCVAFGTEAEFGTDSILAAGTGDGYAALLNMARLNKLGVIVPGSVKDPASKGVTAVAFGPNSSLVTGDASGDAYVWDTATELVAADLTDPASKGVSAVAFGAGASTVATGDMNGLAYLWNTVTQRLIGAFADPAGKAVSSVAFGPGGTLAIGDRNGRIYLWHIIGRAG